MCSSRISRARFSLSPLSRLMPAVEFGAHRFRRCRDRTASPDGLRPRPACRRSGRAHAGGSPRAHRRRPSRASCRPRCRNDLTRTTPAVRRSRCRRRPRHRSGPSLHSGRVAPAVAVQRRVLTGFLIGRRHRVGAGHCGPGIGSIGHGHGGGVASGRLFGALGELGFGAAFSAKVEEGTRRLATRRQVGRGNAASAGALQVGEHGGARIVSNGVDQIANRAEIRTDAMRARLEILDRSSSCRLGSGCCTDCGLSRRRQRCSGSASHRAFNSAHRWHSRGQRSVIGASKKIFWPMRNLADAPGH